MVIGCFSEINAAVKVIHVTMKVSKKYHILQNTNTDSGMSRSRRMILSTFDVSSEHGIAAIGVLSSYDSRRLAEQTNALAGGDKTDTPTDMLHKGAQVAFKNLMTH